MVDVRGVGGEKTEALAGWLCVVVVVFICLFWDEVGWVAVAALLGEKRGEV